MGNSTAPIVLLLLALLALAIYYGRRYLKLKEREKFLADLAKRKAEDAEKERLAALAVPSAIEAFPAKFNAIREVCRPFESEATVAYHLKGAETAFVDANEHVRQGQFIHAQSRLKSAEESLSHARRHFDTLVCARQAKDLLHNPPAA